MSNIRKTIRNILKEHLENNYENENKFKDLIKSDEFKRWFQNSEMEKDGVPMIFYHGTNHTFEKFDKSKFGSSTDSGWLGEGFYFYTDIHEAYHYGKVKAYFLNIENPYFPEYKEVMRLSDMNSKKASKKFSEKLKSEGYDGVYHNADLRGETVVYEPSQIWEIKDIDIDFLSEI